VAAQKFKIGQKVGLLPRNMQMQAIGDFKIVTLMPPSDGENQYRVKGMAEPFERVVKESDIVRR